VTALVAIVPSRGRPQAAREMAATFQETCQAETRLVLAVDLDDPTVDEYLNLLQTGKVDVYLAPGPSTMVRTLNLAALRYAAESFAVAFLGDDHRPRTPGWDTAYVTALQELRTGIVYGNDLLQGEAIPTQVAMTSDIVRTLGHMAPPPLTHLYVDNYWRDLGKAADCIRYLPDVVIEHMHPFAQKAPMDDGYARVNDSLMYARDSVAYAAYVARQMTADAQKVKALRDA
jgi:hypothetical protein